MYKITFHGRFAKSCKEDYFDSVEECLAKAKLWATFREYATCIITNQNRWIMTIRKNLDGTFIMKDNIEIQLVNVNY